MQVSYAHVAQHLVCVLTVAVVQAADAYHQEKEIAIGGEGGWDYLIVDPAAHVARDEGRRRRHPDRESGG